MANTHEHLEHAEHAQHAAHDPFTSRVALTIAVIAAVLAAVTLLSHRTHNETLQLQIEAGILQGRATDKWNEFQANNIRRHEYEANSRLLDFLTKEPAKTDQASSTLVEWKKKVDEYRPKKGEGEDDKKGKLDRLEEEARDFDRQVREKQHESHFTHDQGSRFDLGELAVELGLVLCSIAVLTRKRSFWFGGIAAAAVGTVIAATGFSMTPHADGHGHDGTTTEQHAPAKATEKVPGH